jgi:hypothetical protein
LDSPFETYVKPCAKYEMVWTALVKLVPDPVGNNIR